MAVRDEGVIEGISRQRRWQKKQVLTGNCMICGRPRETHFQRCDYHHEQHRQQEKVRIAVHRAVEEERSKNQ